MKVVTKKFLPWSLVLVSLLFLFGSIVPSLALAANCPQGTKPNNAGICLPDTGPNTGIAASEDLGGLITNILKLLLYVAGALAVLFIIIGGFWYITSSGNEEQAEKGKKALINSIIGLIAVILSYTLVTVIANTLTATR
jgi:hypothetical protein